MVSYSTPNAGGINVTFTDLKSLFKTSSRTYILFASTLTCYQINNIFCLQVKRTLILYLHLVA